MARKLTPTLIGQIKTGHRNGQTYEELSRSFGVSVGSVANALKRPATGAVAAKAQPAAPGPPTETDATPEVPVTQDELRAFLSQQIRGLRTDVETSQDSNAKARANRNLLVATQLLSKITPQPLPDPNEDSDLIALGEQAEATFLKTVDELFAGSATWSKCPTCGAPQVPT